MATGLPKIIYDNRFADATPVASSTDAGYNVLNLRDWKPYTWWKPISLPATVTVDCGVARNADHLLIYGHDLSTSRAAVSVEASTDNFASSIAPLSSSNLLNYSEELNAWDKINTAVIDNAEKTPDGNRTADKIVETAVNNFHWIEHWTGPSMTVGSYLSAMIRLKKGGRYRGAVVLEGATSGYIASCDINLIAGTIVTTSGTVSITALPDDWYEIRLTGNAVNSNNTNARVALYIYNDSGQAQYLGDGNSGIYCGGVQFNYGQSPNHYQSTSGNNNPFLVNYSVQSYRYFRLRIPNFYYATPPSIAIASIGQALEIPRRLKEGFDPIGREPQGQSNRSEAGHPLGRVVDFELWSESLSWKNLNWNWARNSFLPAYKAHLRGNPFAFAWDPVDHADEVYLVNMKKGFKGPHRQGEFCDLSFDVESVL